jgi:hypothetical protein
MAGEVFPVDPAAAHVAVRSIQTEHVPRAAVAAILAHDKLTACYRQQLRTRGARAIPFEGKLHLEFDAGGNVAAATMPAPDFLATAGMCILQLARGRTAAGADPGATADIALAFVPK